jgi:hypothetical protein
MAGKEIDRRQILKSAVLGSATLLPIWRPALGEAAQLHSHAASTVETAPLWKPRFFDESQSKLTATIAELIIPATDTPGAREARVHEHIDLVLSEEVPEVQRAFLEGLSWIEKKSRKLHGSGFLGLNQEQQTAILTLVAGPSSKRQDEAGRQFFQDIRRRTVHAYYTSRIGIHDELTYKGNQTLDTWPGCPHPDHHGDES